VKSLAERAIDKHPSRLLFSTFHMSIVLGILTFVLILVSLFIVLVVLAQKSKDGGMGAALGGGAAEAAFGAETGNVLSKSTIYASVLFFVLAFALYLGRIYESKHASAAAGSALPTIAVPAAATPAPAPAAPAPATEAPKKP
jgi:preprotein translocase subunit SecG